MAEADEDTRSVQSSIVSLDLVNQTYAVTTMKIELFESHIGTKHNVEIETVHTTVVAIPIVGSGGAANSVFGVAS